MTKKTKRKKTKIKIEKTKKRKIERRKRKIKKLYIPKVNIELIKQRGKIQLFYFTNQKGFKTEIKMKKNKISFKIKVPKIFCLISNPNEVFDFIKKLIGVVYSNEIHEIDFDYSEVEVLELGAVMLQNVIVLNLKKLSINMTGNFPPKENIEAMNIFIYSGIYKYLGLNQLILEKIKKPLTLELCGGGKIPPNIPLRKIDMGITEGEITKYFNDCLKLNGFKLKEESERKFDHILSEVLSNCYEHCGSFGQHFCLGHYHEYSKGFGKYQLSIFNFGQTIAEGLEDSSLPNNIKQRIDELLEIHKKKRFFEWGWDKESLLTLFALQDRVSRVYKENATRGTGTIRLIKSFRDIGGTNREKYIPKMTIISGQTQIIFDNSKISELSKNNTIAFNKNNSLEDIPDKNYVKKIDHYFPGTIITLSIFLDKNWITKKKEENSNED